MHLILHKKARKCLKWKSLQQCRGSLGLQLQQLQSVVTDGDEKVSTESHVYSRTQITYHCTECTNA